MGARPRYDLEPSATSEGRGDWDRPLEYPDESGCPGGWYRTAFVNSVLRYYRRQCGERGRIPNRLLEACDDELVIEAVEYMEACEDTWANAHERWQLTQIRRRSLE